MTSEEFVENFYVLRQKLVDLYFDPQGSTEVSKMITDLNLDDPRKKILKEILMGALRDAFYTILLGLEGEAQIGNRQEMYHLTDKQGNALTNGEIESFAWEYFQQARTGN
jgi:hypothetical protein